MEENNVGPMGNVAGGQPVNPEPKSNGALIGAIIIIIILIIGGFYLWQNGSKEESGDAMESTNLTDIDLGAPGATGSLEEDLNSIDLESLDQEL